MTSDTPSKPQTLESERWAELDRELGIWKDSLHRENEMLERLLGSLHALERKMGGVPDAPPRDEPDRSEA